jgi:predicted nucleic acid-binding protein
MTIYFLALSDRLGETRLMDDLKLDYEDSTVAQVAKRLSVEGVVSFDKDFDRAQGILRVEPATLL